jgi:hypothetical protein
MGILSLFTNAGKEGESDVKSPAFSLTKVQAGLGALIAAVTGVVPAALASNQTVVVAAIASGTVVMLGVFALAAVDLTTRQRAGEAKLRWSGGAGNGGQSVKKVGLVANLDDLVLQSKHNGMEYELRFAELEGNKVTLVARKNGKSLEPIFQPRA